MTKPLDTNGYLPVMRVGTGLRKGRNVYEGHQRGWGIEFGAYRGGNAIFMAHLVKELGLGVNVYALDTFAGMPKTDKVVDAHNEGDFRDVDFDELVGYTVSSCIGATEAVEEEVIRRDGLCSEQIFPHFVFRLFASGEAT